MAEEITGTPDWTYGLEPAAPLRFMKDILEIPHCSHNEKALAEYISDFAKERGLTTLTDSTGNVLVKKPSQSDCESAPPLALQAHLDMVCEKTEDSAHDFATDAIQAISEDNYLTAKDTTLGADDAVGVSAILAILDDPHLPHPPLECLFTVREEIDMGGAYAVEPEWITAKRLINLDAEEEGVLIASSAGGASVTIEREFTCEPIAGDVYKITIGGLTGGHSGVDINKNRANANKLIGRILHLLRGVGYGLVSINGGAAENAIPRSSSALVSVAPDQTGDFQNTISYIKDILIAETEGAEPDLDIIVEPASGECQMDDASFAAVDVLLNLIPNGVYLFNPNQDMVIASENLGVVETTEHSVRMNILMRSSLSGTMEAMKGNLLTLGALADAAVSISGEFPGWAFTQDSQLRTTSETVYMQMFGEALAVEGIHAGLESGAFANKWPGIDIISIGPTITGAHSPDERLDLASYEKFYYFLEGLVARLCAAMHKDDGSVLVS
ncbi:MAG: beta-Ala-His dipeptidase [Oscillospiraceae bacterium]|jgi:dipeptidase D|nr:beta-Ala-His dipeptidase [Oscillospiraceae bacterium]